MAKKKTKKQKKKKKMKMKRKKNVLHLTQTTITSTYKVKSHFFRHGPSDRAQILHACADRDEIGSQLKKI